MLVNVHITCNFPANIVRAVLDVVDQGLKIVIRILIRALEQSEVRTSCIPIYTCSEKIED